METVGSAGRARCFDSCTFSDQPKLIITHFAIPCQAKKRVWDKSICGLSAKKRGNCPMIPAPPAQVCAHQYRYLLCGDSPGWLLPRARWARSVRDLGEHNRERALRQPGVSGREAPCPPPPRGRMKKRGRPADAPPDDLQVRRGSSHQPALPRVQSVSKVDPLHAVRGRGRLTNGVPLRSRGRMKKGGRPADAPTRNHKAQGGIRRPALPRVQGIRRVEPLHALRGRRRLTNGVPLRWRRRPARSCCTPCRQADIDAEWAGHPARAGLCLATTSPLPSHDKPLAGLRQALWRA